MDGYRYSLSESLIRYKTSNYVHFFRWIPLKKNEENGIKIEWYWYWYLIQQFEKWWKWWRYCLDDHEENYDVDSFVSYKYLYFSDVHEWTTSSLRKMLPWRIHEDCQAEMRWILYAQCAKKEKNNSKNNTLQKKGNKWSFFPSVCEFKVILIWRHWSSFYSVFSQIVKEEISFPLKCVKKFMLLTKSYIVFKKCARQHYPIIYSLIIQPKNWQQKPASNNESNQEKLSFWKKETGGGKDFRDKKGVEYSLFRRRGIDEEYNWRVALVDGNGSRAEKRKQVCKGGGCVGCTVR